MILTFPRPDIRRRNLTLTLNTIIGILCVEDNHISSSFQYFASLPIPRREYLESSFYLSTPLPKTIRNKHYKDGFSIQIKYQHCPLPHGNANDDAYYTSTTIHHTQTLSKQLRQQQTAGTRKKAAPRKRAAAAAQQEELEKARGRSVYATPRVGVRHVHAHR